VPPFCDGLGVGLVRQYLDVLVSHWRLADWIAAPSEHEALRSATLYEFRVLNDIDHIESIHARAALLGYGSRKMENSFVLSKGVNPCSSFGDAAISQKNPPDSGGVRPESACSPMTFSL
jgi:hypothetical protein